ncbi:diphthine synthase [Candidatus Micrarchaeota archaeon]|nr:diphthine synthase [Candidatus Micrarchaeota archaeon]
MTFSIISAGINFDLTLNGFKELQKCDEIYAEIYTSPIPEEFVCNLELKLGKKIKLIERASVESDFLVEKAEEKKVGLIVVGDALIATTHIILLIECKKRGIKTNVIHNSSIFCAAIGKSGLQPYRFGKSATLPFWRKNHEPVSPLETVEENIKRNLHTMLFLDLKDDSTLMKPGEGLEMIEKIEGKIKRKIVREVVVLAKVGYPDEKISFGTPDELNKKELGGAPAVFIIPAKLHPVEEEYLEQI